MVGPQPMFLNAAATGESTLSAPALLDVLLAVEQRFGRERPYAGAPRTIDLDLILYGNDVIDDRRADGAASAIPRAAVRARAAGRNRG